MLPTPSALVRSLLLPLIAVTAMAAPRPGLRFAISFPPARSATPLDGRLLLLISKDSKTEPRFEISDQPATQQMFGVDVEGWAPGTRRVVEAAALGYPLDSLADVPAGDYTVQALLNRYTTFHRADGHTVQLPMDEGEGQQWNRKPGNLYSAPKKVHLDPQQGSDLALELDLKIPPIVAPADTPYVKHVRIESALLTRFWGRPMYLGAQVLLPEGWDTHPQAHFPLIVFQGHFPADFGAPLPFRTVPPEASAPEPERNHQAAAYRFYQDWTSGHLPHVLILSIQHANPYYDDSYAVNSANLGPYGDAITQELIPAIEKSFRGIGQGWARAVYGGSTGGWEALASQVFYPDFYNGAWCSCPDPVDFRAYQIINIYDDPNAMFLEGPWSRVPRPAVRKPDGTVVTTMEREIRRELVLGTHGRSTDQFGIWQAVFSPVGADGYPAPIWDERSGVIDHRVAAYWKQHYDLRAIMQRDWGTLGPKLVDKLHVQVGEMDTYYLNNAVHLLQDFLATTTAPAYRGDFDYGPRMPHCYTGDPGVSLAVSSGTVVQRFLPRMVAHFEATAPAGADMTSWKY